MFTGHEPCIFQRSQIPGAGAENRYLFILGHLPQRFRSWVKRMAIIQHDGCANPQGADQPVPHHPATGREVENRIFPFQVGMQNSASALDHAFGQTRGAG